MATEKKNFAFMGCGDLLRKASKLAIPCIKNNGYEVVAVDFKPEPVGLQPAQPNHFFDCSNEADYSEFTRIAEKEKFEAIYVANPGDAHLITLLQLHHFAKRIIISKPLDTHVGLLCTARKQEDLDFRYILPKVTVHDHYLNKPGVEFLARRLMPRLQAEHGFLDYVVMFLVENKSIEEHEQHRVEGLNCGMLFDLGVHLTSILDLLLPCPATWEGRTGTHERRDRSIEVIACETGRFGGSFLGDSTVIPSKRAETFGIVELAVTQTVQLQERLKTTQRIRVLAVVGKGVPIDNQTDRDLKAVQMVFQGGAEVVLDIDTHRFHGVDERLLREEGYYDLDLTQKGINKALVAAAQSDFVFSADRPFQEWGPALRSVLLLFESLAIAENPVGYEDGVFCRDLTTRLLQRNPRFSQWALPDRLQDLVIGSLHEGAVP